MIGSRCGVVPGVMRHASPGFNPSPKRMITAASSASLFGK